MLTKICAEGWFKRIHQKGARAKAEGCMIFHLAHEIFINVGMEMSIKRLLLSFIYTLFYQNPSKLKF